MNTISHQPENFHWIAIRKRLESQENLSTAFLNQLESVFMDTDTFDPECFADFKLQEIFVYLKTSHVYYLNVWLPKIENTLQQLFDKFGERYLSVQVLHAFIHKYKKELVNHIEHEEQVLFAFVEGLLNGDYNSDRKDFVISHFIHTHNDNVILHLEELKKDLVTFDHQLKENMVFQVLFHQLNIFQSDLLVHGLIEDHVFMKKVLSFIHLNFEKMGHMTNE